MLRCGVWTERRMESQTKHEIWIMTVSTLVTAAVATVALAAFGQVH